MKREFRFVIPDHQTNEPMNENVVKQLIGNHLQLWINNDFHIGKIESKGNIFEARVLAAGAVFTDRTYAVDKYTGWVKSIS